MIGLRQDKCDNRFLVAGRPGSGCCVYLSQ
jgi:hypothetical protein